ncbi:LPS-assembly protein LptD [Methylocucumis oryzae]|nr:LPS-assembly protein LptD [Methylocucumis oryzae]
MSFMFRRFILVCLPSLSASVSLADSSAWNCKQDAQTKQWVCLGDTSQKAVAESEPSASIPIKPLAEPAPAVIEPVKPELAKPDVRIQPIEKKPLSIPRAESITPIPPVTVKACDSEKSCASRKLPLPPFETQDHSFRLLAPIFDHEQERVFYNLYGQLKHDPWENCLSLTNTPRSWAADHALRNQSPLEVTSNYSEIFDNEIGTYSGQVQMDRADQHAEAHIANYDSVSQTLDLHGDVYYSEDEIALHSDTASLQLDSDQATLRDTLFIYPSTPLRGLAKAVYRDSQTLSHYKDVTYTSCKPGNQDWAIHASELKLNKETGKGSAKHTWLEFKGVPVFYSPYLAFPADNRRLSGFLAPSFGNTQTSGFNIMVPYYWNIAPNYDATLSPRYFTKRGVLLGGDFRYLSEQSRGIISAEYMPEDSILNTDRYQGSLKHTTIFTPNLSANLDLNYVSDKNYFAELGNALSFPNFSFVKSEANVNYVRPGMSFMTRVESYQTIDASLKGGQIPYRRLPQVNLSFNHSFATPIALDTLFETEMVNFQHGSLVNGQRFNIKPSISVPLQTASTYVTPKLAVQHTQYWLNNPNPGLSSELDRTLPIVSVDSGLFLEREVTIADTGLVHTLEPRLFYLYIPKTDQSQIPLFDTSVYDFWYSSMFRENRFSGSDRIQDANQITAALTTRLVEPSTGLERLRFSIGEIFYFRNREVTLCGEYPSSFCAISPVETATQSPLATELSSQLTRHISIDGGLQWDPDTNSIVRGKAALHFVNQPDQIINLGYLYRLNPLIPDRSNDITQSDISFRWPIYDNWYGVGRWQYSWLYNNTQDGFIGVEKENCCWRFRVIYRSYLNSLNPVIDANQQLSNYVVEGTQQSGVFFQIELKGLTGIGEKLDNFFESSIYGYRKPD